MKKDTKESPWPFFQPAYFRHWTRRKMKPMPYYTALKKKEKLSICYFFSAVVLLHYCIYDRFYKNKKSTADPENDDLRLIMAVSQTKETKATIFSFDQFRLASIQDFDQKEWEKAVEEKNKV